MPQVMNSEMAEDQRTMLETINAYQEELAAAQSQIEVLEYGLGVLRKTVKEEFK